MPCMLLFKYRKVTIEYRSLYYFRKVKGVWNRLSFILKELQLKNMTINIAFFNELKN